MKEFKEFIPLPNELLEALSKAQIKGIITGREGGVIGFIIRNTYGYQKEVNTLKTSFIARELGTNVYNISKILKRREKRNIIIRDGNEISINRYYREWKKIKLPHHFENIATIDNVATNVSITTCNSIDTNGKKYCHQYHYLLPPMTILNLNKHK